MCKKCPRQVNRVLLVTYGGFPCLPVFVINRRCGYLHNATAAVLSHGFLTILWAIDLITGRIFKGRRKGVAILLVVVLL